MDARKVDLLLTAWYEVASVDPLCAEQQLTLGDGARPGDDRRCLRHPPFLLSGAN